MMDLEEKQTQTAVQGQPSRWLFRLIRMQARVAGYAWLGTLSFAASVWGQDAISSSDAAYRATDFTVPQTRLRPIGAPSAVDQFRAPSAVYHDRGDRQAAFLQSSDAAAVPPPSLPSGGFAMPPGTGLPAPLGSSTTTGPINLPPTNSFNTAPLPPNNVPIGNGNSGITPLPMPQPSTVVPRNPAVSTSPQVGGTFAPVPRPVAIGGQSVPGGDYAPMPHPQLGNQFATLGNCRNISAPSGYRSDRILTCGQPTSFVTPVAATSQPPFYSPPPAQIGPPVILPPVQMGAPTQIGAPIGSTQTVIPGPAGYRPLISFGQERYPVQIGQGLYGQPVAYVPGQSFRNALRYIAW